MKNFIRSWRKSFAQAIAQNDYIVLWQKKYPRFFSFVKKRLALAKPRGFSFTLGIAFSALFFVYFLSLIQDTLAKDPFVEADIRITNLMVTLRSLKLAKILLFFTYLGNWQMIISLGLVSLIVFWLWRKKQMAIFLAGGLLSGELIYNLFKFLLHRQRPDIRFSLIPQNGYAFPSGHAVMSLIFYGIVGYFLARTCKNRWLKFLIMMITFVLVFLIGFSRIYLGVHWASDVVAGWSLGLSLLILCLTFFGQRKRFFPQKKDKLGVLERLGKWAIFVISSLLVFEGVFIYFFYQKHPLQAYSITHPHQIIKILPSQNLPEIVLQDNFPKFSEGLVGQKMEPVSFIVVGQEETLIQIFQKAGWFMADRPLRALWRSIVTALLNQPYPTAPVTPSFLNAEPETLAFEKLTPANTVRQRHHTRFWLTDFRVGETPVWVATASFDEGLRYLITHKINPDIDTEREFIREELLKTGLVKSSQQIQLVKPLLGKNQSQDLFFTDGKAYILMIY